MVEILANTDDEPVTIAVPRRKVRDAEALITRLKEIGAQVDKASTVEMRDLDEEVADLLEALADMFKTLLESVGLTDPQH